MHFVLVAVAVDDFPARIAPDGRNAVRAQHEPIIYESSFRVFVAQYPTNNVGSTTYCKSMLHILSKLMMYKDLANRDMFAYCLVPRFHAHTINSFPFLICMIKGPEFP